MFKAKRVLAFILCLFMFAAVAAGCGKTGEPASGNSNDSTEKVTQADSTTAGVVEAKKDSGKAEFWNDKMTGLDKEILTSLTSAMKKDSGVDVEIVSYPDVAAYQTALQQSIKDSTAPGMFTWWSGDQLNTLAKNGLLEDLTEEWDNYYIPSGVSADVKNALSFDGKAYAAPYTVLNNTVIYNKDAFTKAGCEEPTTFDEFLAVCEKLMAAGITPIGWKNDSWASFIWFQQMLAVYDINLYNGVCDGSISYTDPKIVEVMKAWKSMIEKGYFAKPVAYDDYAKALALGKTAMILEPSLIIPDLVNDYGLVSGTNFDAMTVPSINGAKTVVFFEVSPLAIPAASKDKEAGKLAVRAFLNADAQRVMANETGMPASGKADIKDPTIAKMSAFSTQADKYQLVLRFYESTPSELRDVALSELSKFMYSGAPIDQVLGAIQKKADEVFKK